MKRHSTFTPYAKRLTPTEVAAFWFRRGPDFSRQIPMEYPNFPLPGPDGLFLLSEVETWFDQFHGKRQAVHRRSTVDEEEDALRIARGH